MNKIVDEIKKKFPKGRFNKPSNEETLERVEKMLGIKFPGILRDLYLSFDGFRENKGNAAYLLPLEKDNGAGTIISTNKLIWDDWKQYYPNFDLSKFLFFGMSGGDEFWGINLENNNEIVVYHHTMQDQYELIGNSILKIYLDDQVLYDEIEDT